MVGFIVLSDVYLSRLAQKMVNVRSGQQYRSSSVSGSLTYEWDTLESLRAWGIFLKLTSLHVTHM